MCFQNYGLGKKWLANCLKMLVWEDLSTSNMLNGLKHCVSLQRNYFNIFIGQHEQNFVGKSFL